MNSRIFESLNIWIPACWRTETHDSKDLIELVNNKCKANGDVAAQCVYQERCTGCEFVKGYLSQHNTIATQVCQPRTLAYLWGAALYNKYSSDIEVVITDVSFNYVRIKVYFEPAVPMVTIIYRPSLQSYLRILKEKFLWKLEKRHTGGGLECISI